MAGHTDNEVCIDAPPDFGWWVTNEVRDWPRLFPGYEGIWIPKNIRHRVSNERDTPVRAVFQLATLAPRPEIGHVDTKPQPGEPVAGDGTQWPTGAGRSGSEPVAALAGEG